MALTLEKVPAAIQGIALGNAGLASLFLVLGKIYQKNDECVVVVYILAPVSLFFLLLYLGKTFLYPKAFMKDAASPTTNFTYGATAICLSLLSSFLALPQLGLHYKYGFGWRKCCCHLSDFPGSVVSLHMFQDPYWAPAILERSVHINLSHNDHWCVGAYAIVGPTFVLVHSTCNNGVDNATTNMECSQASSNARGHWRSYQHFKIEQ